MRFLVPPMLLPPMLLLISALSVSPVRAETDCALGERYIELARARQEAADLDEAVQFLRQAIDACPNYEAHQSFGDLESQSPQRDDRARAVDAFVAAYELAATDAERARTLFSYSRLLNKEGDPTNAYPLIKSAHDLDPTDADIKRLSDQIEVRVNNPTKDSITRGLWDSLYKPLRLASATTAHGKATSGSLTNASGNALNSTQQPAVIIPINFETGTTIVDEPTRANIAILAHTLAAPDHPNQLFIFVGHADVRGVERNNLPLSKRRAEAIYQAVTLLEPSLRGRIEVIGKGSSEPIDFGENEQAYRANRRLQVLLR
jgi:outer membrane protein OmpA-like peptidoglycan-associated protein